MESVSSWYSRQLSFLSAIETADIVNIETNDIVKKVQTLNSDFRAAGWYGSVGWKK